MTTTTATVKERNAINASSDNRRRRRRSLTLHAMVGRLLGVWAYAALFFCSSYYYYYWHWCWLWKVLPVSAVQPASLGVHVVRSPESAVAPQGDEVVFECELNLAPERLEWKFRPANLRTIDGSNFQYLPVKVNHCCWRWQATNNSNYLFLFPLLWSPLSLITYRRATISSMKIASPSYVSLYSRRHSVTINALPGSVRRL